MSRVIAALMMSLLLASPAFAQSKSFLVLVQINEKILPVARGFKYADPLDVALRQNRLGAVTGEGTQLARDGSVEWVDLKVDLVSLDSGVPFLKAKLRELGAPRGSLITYEQFGKKIEVPVHDQDATRPGSAQSPQPAGK